ncbi:MAG: AsmA-like C-terminal region-containing protein, partial [Flavobacteriales bacterium]
LKGDFDLKELSDFLKIENIESITGSISLDNQFRGSISANNTMQVTEFTGNAKLLGASMKLKGAENAFENFVGDIQFNRFNSNAKISGNYGSSDLLLSSQFSNFIPYLFYDKELKSNVYLQSNLLELDKLLGNNQASIESGADTTGVKLPKNINATLRANIKKLTYQKHNLSALSGTLFVSDDKVKTSNLKFEGNGGSYALEGDLAKKGEEFALSAKVICGQIMINDFLEKFNNFGQTVLRHDHLSGRANALITMKAKLSKNLEVDMETLDANTEFSVTKGILKNLELFDEIGQYLKSNVISRNIVKVDELAKKLKTVHFSEFNNTIIVKDSKITIPNMFLKTSAMDIGIYGSQTFDYDINYGMNLRLTDILTKKKDTEYGYIVDDGTGARLFMLMTGTIDKPIFKLDKEARKEHNKKQRQEEKNNVKNILKDEFGFFKKDTTLKTEKTEEKAKPKFQVDWGEEKPKGTKIIEEKPNKEEEKTTKEEPKEKSRRQKWLDKLKGKEEKKDKVGFEID